MVGSYYKVVCIHMVLLDKTGSGEAEASSESYLHRPCVVVVDEAVAPSYLLMLKENTEPTVMLAHWSTNTTGQECH